MGTEALLSVEQLTVTVPHPFEPGERRTVVDRVDLQVRTGEALGLVGESGSGKSMTARSVMRLLAPGVRAEGCVMLGGRNILEMDAETLRRTRAERMAMIYQDPRAHINPVRTVGDFLTEGMRVTGVSRSEATARAVKLLDDVQVSDAQGRMNQYPHELSGGLLQRVVIAAALSQDPELILADEPTTALDVTTQAEVMAILDDLRRERGLSLLFITHDLELAAATCDRTGVMYAGRIVEIQESAALQQSPTHPYTSGLMMARPDIEIIQPELTVIPGTSVSAYEAMEGCAFASRCAFASDICLSRRPEMARVGNAEVACHHARELLGTLPNKIEEIPHA